MKDWKLKMEMEEWKKNTNSDIHTDVEEYLNCEECDSQFAGKGYLENHRK